MLFGIRMVGRAGGSREGKAFWAAWGPLRIGGRRDSGAGSGGKRSKRVARSLHTG